MFHLLQVDDVGLWNLLQGKHLLSWTYYLLHSTESARAQGLSHFVFWDIVRITTLLYRSFGFRLAAFGVGPEGRTYFLLFSLLLQLFQFVEQEVELFRVHFKISYKRLIMRYHIISSRPTHRPSPSLPRWSGKGWVLNPQALKFVTRYWLRCCSFEMLWMWNIQKDLFVVAR
jgi:hypothetical protein